MKVIDGKALAAKLRAELKEKIEASGKEIGLAVVIVGDDPASRIYVRNKIKACGEVGIRSYSYELPADVRNRSWKGFWKNSDGRKRCRAFCFSCLFQRGWTAFPR